MTGLKDNDLITILYGGPHTISEIDHLAKKNGLGCPDDLARKVSQMRKKGIIHGEFSEERSAWIYWADKPPEDEK